jgi:hypothetical protein
MTAEIINPAPEAPRWFADELRRIGGVNRFGGPRWQVVWGGSETKYFLEGRRLKYPRLRERVVDYWEEYAEGRIVAVHPAGTGEVVTENLIRPVFKIVETGHERWMLEMWHSPERCAPGWERRRWLWLYDEARNCSRMWDALGPAPTSGQYRLHKMLETPAGEFLPLERNVLEYVERLIRAFAASSDGTPLDEPLSDRMLAALALEDKNNDEARERRQLEAEIEERRSRIAPHIGRIYTLHPNEGRGY